MSASIIHSYFLTPVGFFPTVPPVTVPVGFFAAPPFPAAFPPIFLAPPAPDVALFAACCGLPGIPVTFLPSAGAAFFAGALGFFAAGAGLSAAALLAGLGFAF